MLLDAISNLRSGKVVAFPTETFYGLGVDPANETAVTKLLDIKNRSIGEGVPFILGSAKSAETFCDLTDPIVRQTFFLLAEAFWPGPLTLVLPMRKDAAIDQRLLGGGRTIAVRHSSNQIASELAAGINGIIPATSANPHGLAPASSCQMARNYFKPEDVYVVEGETLGAKLPSTLVKITADGLVFLREGAVPFDNVSELLFK